MNKTTLIYVRSENFTEAKTDNIFSGYQQCLVENYRRFRDYACLHREGLSGYKPDEEDRDGS
jgi:hypothetical protein